MWLMTPRGFYSAVEDRHDSTRVIVRSRDVRDLENLRDLIDGLTIEWTQKGDYCCRTRCSKLDWKRALLAMTNEIDYDNFKNEISRRDKIRARIYGSVWWQLLAIEDDEKFDPLEDWTDDIPLPSIPSKAKAPYERDYSRKHSLTGPAEVGQIWASNRKKDRKSGKRQTRMVTSVSNGKAQLQTVGSPLTKSIGVKLDRRGNIVGHRRIS